MIQRIIQKFSTVKLHNLLYDNNKQWNLIVLHGLLGSHKNFRSLMKNKQLNSETNIHMIDNRNHGNSPHTTQHSYILMANDLKNYIEDHGLKKVLILGHSMGGGVVYTFSALYPELQSIVKQLIIVDMPLKIVERRVNEDILTGLSNIDLKQSRQTIMKQIQNIGKIKTMSDFLKTNLRHNKDGEYEWIPNIPSLRSNYSNIVSEILDKPTEWKGNVDILYGDRSNVCNKYQCLRLRQFYPNFTQDNIHEIQNAGHWLHFDNSGDFMKTLNQIVKKNTKKS